MLLHHYCCRCCLLPLMLLCKYAGCLFVFMLLLRPELPLRKLED